jgi:UDPglucose--hexose-1-phosphate uridylyltransferase
VRIVPNKYPALGAAAPQAVAIPLGNAGVPSAAISSSQPALLDESLYVSAPGYGRHEVVIESANHVESFSDLSDSQAYWTFYAFRDRLLTHRRDPHLVSSSVFKNVGPEGGASLVHSHSQVLSLPQTPQFLTEELAGAERFFRRHRKCIFCTLADRERELDVRLVARSETCLAFCPYASGFAYETWIMPLRHASHFEHEEDAVLRDAALLLKRVICAMERSLSRPAYNFFLHTTPFDREACDHYHWHIELFPRLAKAAGFEWGSGWRLNAVAPERAAAVLRTAV